MNNCCINCFQDRFLKQIIKTKNRKGICDYCDSEDVFVINTSEIADKFNIFTPYYELLEHGTNFIYGDNPTEVGEFLYVLIQNEWNIFEDSLTPCENLFDDIMYHTDMNFDCSDLYVRAEHSFTFRSYHDYWDQLTEEIKHGNRFFPQNGFISEDIAGILEENVFVLPQNSILYRGRIGKHSIDTMGAPPNQYAAPGRANPKGISYLYTATDSATCIAELRPYKSAEISIVELTTKKVLHLVSLNTGILLISPFQYKDLLTGVGYHRLFNRLVFDLSKPVIPDNTEIEYLPTQYLSELIKSNRYDGFRFKSSLGKADNIVIFDESNVHFDSIDIKVVKDINYSFQ